MATRDVSGSSRISPAVALMIAALGLGACAPPPHADVIATTLCVTPATTASDIRVELKRRIERGGYGDTSAAQFGAQYVDLGDPLLRPNVTCCGEARSFDECRDGATPVDLFIDVRRELTPEQKEQVRRQLAVELDAAFEAVRR